MPEIVRNNQWECYSCISLIPTTTPPTATFCRMVYSASNHGFQVVEGNRQYWCENCVITCDDCGAISGNSEDGVGYGRCSDCNENYYNCYGCHQPVHENDVHHPTDDVSTCDRCLARYWVWCDGCGGYERIGSECGREEEEDSERRSRDMYAYHDRPNLRFHRAEGERRQPSTLFLGWELEIEAGDAGTTREYFPCEPWAWKSHDGSLDYGIEYVSHPMTYAYVTEKRKEIAEWLAAVRRAGGRSYDTATCGMHVHLSRQAFGMNGRNGLAHMNGGSSLHLYKFMKLFYDNPMFVLAISQRKPELLDRWATLDGSDRKSLLMKAKYKFDNGNAGRYAAVNLENRHTVECRIFRGSLRQASFFKNIEFTVAAWEYTKDAAVSMVNAKNFVEWVGKRKRVYPYLDLFLKRERVVKSYA